MKRLLLTLLIVLFASTSLAGATLGLYFDLWPGKMAYAPPEPMPSFFDVYLYLHASNYYVTALEYQLTTPNEPAHTLFIINTVTPAEQAVVTLGSPWEGHSLAFWPPLDGYTPGYNMICKYTCMTLTPCLAGLVDYPIVVGPHPGSGQLWGTFYPNNETFPIIGLTSILCPYYIGVQNTSWGAIKSLY
ncbi:MAG: hypothetical protein NTW97_11000 [Candidatus Krumholzibacteria bacterium]|nr:hypothetical protein [Candidatus Krumholzibacteria bacterium]